MSASPGAATDVPDAVGAVVRALGARPARRAGSPRAPVAASATRARRAPSTRPLAGPIRCRARSRAGTAGGRAGAARPRAQADAGRAQRRPGLRRARHVEVDDGLLVRGRADSARAREGDRPGAPRAVPRGAVRNRLAHRPSSAAPLPDCRHGRLRANGARFDRDRAAAAGRELGARVSARRALTAGDERLLHRAEARGRRLHRRRERADRHGLRASAEAGGHQDDLRPCLAR